MRNPFADMRIRTRLLLSYVVVICFTIISSSLIMFNVSQRAIKDHVRRQDNYLAEQLAINLSAQFKSMEELQFSQYYYSLLGGLLAQTPSSPIDRANRERKINDCITSLCYAKSLIDGACVIDNAGDSYSVNINRAFDAAASASSLDMDLIARRRGRPVWSVSDQGRLLMGRQLININDTRVVGTLIMMIDPKLITQVYASSQEANLGDIVLYDAGQRLLPVTSPETGAVAEDYLGHGDQNGEDVFVSGGAEYIISRVSLPGNDFSLLNIVSVQALGGYTRSLLIYLSILAALTILAAALIARLVSGMVTGSIQNLVKGIRRFAAGDLDTPVEVQSRDEVGYLTEEFNRMAEDIKKLIEDVYAADANKKAAEINALQFEYSALESKINPHFLYNTLESVNSLAKLKGETLISEIVCLLGTLLRDNISATADIIPIGRELQNIETYLQLQRLTYGDKFEVDIRLEDGTEDALVPKFILQPLVENAILHGVLESTRKGRIALHARAAGERLHIELSDNGAGMSEAELGRLLDYSVEVKNEAGTHAKVGVRAVDKRLKILYGEAYGLTISSEEAQGTRILIQMPLMRAERHEGGASHD